MFDTINGLPVHVLVIHAVVVLLPLAAVGAIALALRPRWRRSYGWLVLGITALATAAIPVAVKSGEALATRVGAPGEHEDLGRQLLFFAIPLLILVAALVVLDRRRVAVPALAGYLLSAVVVVGAVATTVQVYRVGDSGARVAWEGKIAATTP